MQVEMLQLCRAATERGPYLDVIGIHDTIHTVSMPFELPDCAIVASVRFNPSEAGQKTFKVNFIDADMKRIIPPLTARIPVFEQGRHPRPFLRRIILRLKNVVLGAFGEYSIDLSIDDQHVSSMPFFVLPAESAMART